MSRRFCIKCGKENVELLPNFLCVDCYIETKWEELVRLPRIITQKRCKVCGAVYRSGKWVNYPQGTDLSTIVEDELYGIIEPDSQVREYSLKVKGISFSPQGQYIAEVVIEGKVLDRNLQFVKNVILDLKSSICEKCLKRKTKYYEAIIQLRGKGRVGIDSEIKKAFESILEPEEVSNISDIVESKEGRDYYFINKSVARRIVNRLASKYKIEVKES
ncbi:MAG: 60S ribosomal export protein NMD3, partial [Sulfolobaceae archaeon]